MKAKSASSCELLKGGHIGNYIGATIGGIQGDTRSLDYISCEPFAAGEAASG